MMINMVIVGYQDHSMVIQTTQRSRNLAPSSSTYAPETSARQVEVLVIDTTYHTREDNSLRYDAIY